MITLKGNGYTKQDYAFIYIMLSTMSDDVMCNRICTECGNKTACDDLKRLSEYARQKLQGLPEE